MASEEPPRVKEENPASAGGGAMEEEAKETITIKVRDADRDITVFKIKRTTKMDRVMRKYAERKGVDRSMLRFILDGERVQNEATPNSLELEENDIIDCMMEQLGG